MVITVPFDLTYEFSVKALADEVFAVLADVPASASHFPKLVRIVDLGDQTFRWELEKLGTAQVHIQTIYASRYVSSRKEGSVVWTAIKGVGNALIDGSWQINEQNNVTALLLNIRGELTVPLPTLMKLVVNPMVNAENESMIETYVDNLTKRFGDEASAAT